MLGALCPRNSRVPPEPSNTVGEVTVPPGVRQPIWGPAVPVPQVPSVTEQSYRCAGASAIVREALPERAVNVPRPSVPICPRWCVRNRIQFVHRMFSPLQRSTSLSQPVGLGGEGVLFAVRISDSRPHGLGMPAMNRRCTEERSRRCARRTRKSRRAGGRRMVGVQVTCPIVLVVQELHSSSGGPRGRPTASAKTPQASTSFRSQLESRVLRRRS